MVLASSLTPPNVVERLESLGITVFVLDPHNISEVIEGIEKVAIISGAEDKGKELKEAMEEEVREVRDKVSHLSPEERPTVFHLLWHDPLWTAGKDTFVNEFITIAGGKMHLLIYLAMSLWIWKSYSPQPRHQHRRGRSRRRGKPLLPIFALR